MQTNPDSVDRPAEPRSLELLRELVAFATVSRRSNLALIDHVQTRLEAAGVACERVTSEDGTRANLYAHTGPTDRPGVMLSGHTDVVPVEGQQWSVEPFTLTEHEDRLYGRGTADMKGFVASAVEAMVLAAGRKLEQPLQLALSYDEEIGCIGVRRLLDMLEHAPYRSVCCIVGEPTGLRIATGHKGKVALRATFVGREAHSALAPSGVNAIYLASEFIGALRRLQTHLEHEGASDAEYEVPYTTVHVGTISGGTALNIVPNRCVLDFEIRALADDDSQALLARIREDAERIVGPVRARAPETDIVIELVTSYPGLDTPADAEAVTLLKSLTGSNATTKVAFGTEAGLFDTRLGISSVVFGPGSMAEGHKPDEFITRAQLARCDAVLEKLVDRLSA